MMNEEECEYFKKKSWKIQALQELPYLPTPKEVIEYVFQELSKKSFFSSVKTMVDLGAGDGRIIIYLAEHFNIQCTGLEIDNELIEYAQKQIQEKNLSHICRMIEADLFNYDLSPFDLVTLFILPSSHRLLRHVFSRIKKGAFVLSIKWNLEKLLPYASLTLMEEFKKFPHYPLFLYKKT